MELGGYSTHEILMTWKFWDWLLELLETTTKGMY